MSVIRKRYRELVTDVVTYLNLHERVLDASIPLNHDLLQARREALARMRAHVTGTSSLYGGMRLHTLHPAQVQVPNAPSIEADEGEW